ncbi:MAG: hypothetical protein VKJ64_06435 [Leptolyngbyaceae bacterium]|nr:hypothetical protein [Leptolyngbyaceae bacterium]
MAIAQKENTIILEMTGKGDDIKDLRYGEGKLFKKIRNVIESLKEDGTVGENVQPVVVIVRKKKSSDW